MKSIIKNRDGFSLLEIMLVVAITGILATLAVSSMQTMSLRQQKNAAADEIAALLNQGRFLARGSARQVTLTVNTVSAMPGGSIVATIGAPVNWSKSVNLGANSDYNIVGLWDANPGTSTFTILPKGFIMPEGAVSPAGFSLRVRDREYAENGQQVTITVGILGDVTVTGS
ncbi:prepilin-type N-terminal cleavage/methylation domain-containing protein [Nitrospira defluvii]|nr:prepilin-type N-terminal cleavage/methylation domain-containing protein [Nitrospira defluvii]